MKPSVTDGPALFGGGRGGAHEQAGADDGADAEHDQVEGAERALEAVVALGLGAQLRRPTWSRTGGYRHFGTLLWVSRAAERSIAIAV